MRHVFIPVRSCGLFTSEASSRAQIICSVITCVRQASQTVDLRDLGSDWETMYLSKTVLQNNNTGLMNVQHVYTPSTLSFLDLCVLPNPLVYG